MTNADRFRHLHDVAREVLAELESQYLVSRREGYGLDAGIESRGLVHPTVVLAPTDENAAPIAVAFTDFPGVIVRIGMYAVSAFPACGCDACDEDPAAEAARFRSMVSDVTLGRFREFVTGSPSAPTSVGHELGEAPAHRPSATLHGMRATLEPGTREHVIAWAPWPQRVD